MNSLVYVGIRTHNAEYVSSAKCLTRQAVIKVVRSMERATITMEVFELLVLYQEKKTALRCGTKRRNYHSLFASRQYKRKGCSTHKKQQKNLLNLKKKTEQLP